MPNDNKLYKVWDKNADYILSEDSYKTEKSLAEIVGEIFCPGPFYYYIIDFKTRKLEHVSGSIEKILNKSQFFLFFYTFRQFFPLFIIGEYSTTL